LVQGLDGQRGEPVLTIAGFRLLWAAHEWEEQARAGKPRWDARERKLWWCGRLVKELHREAPAQGAVLAWFEAQGWPGRIDDPLEAEPWLDRKRRLNQTIKDLNDRLAAGTIRFHGDGTGVGVCWREVK
jgi:hypothetical protein